ncbi:MAG: extracellular solute-binding protein [Terriglobales bacterium]
MVAELSRRDFLLSALGGGAALAALSRRLETVEVAYAGSMASVMSGALRQAALQKGWNLRGRAQGATALASLIVGGSLHPDVFISITASPMQRVRQAGRADGALPFAATEMTLAYAPQGRWAHRLQHEPWWEVLQQPGFRFGRSDPRTDPQGRNIIYTCLLAEAYYHQPGVAHRVLGAWINPAQIFAESMLEARVQSGELDATAAYRFQPAAYGLAALPLPATINLKSLPPSAAPLRLTFGPESYHPEPLIFYAAALREAPHPAAARAFVAWLGTPEAQSILREAGYGGV